MREKANGRQDDRGAEKRFSRRHLMYGLGAVGLAVAAYKLKDGISLDRPPLELRSVFVDRTPEGVQTLSNSLEEEGREEMMTVTTQGRLLYEPSGVFFGDEAMPYIHRANDIEFITKAHEMGARLFDIDANLVNGVIYGDHGIIPQYDRSVFGRRIKGKLPLVIDVNEKELKLGAPKYTYEQLVAYIATLSTEEWPLAVSTELKRGDFDQNTVMELLEIHRLHGIPAVFHSTDPELLRIIGSEIAQSYEAAG